MEKNKLTVAHLGDSRAVIAKQTSGQWEGADLTEDHKPTLERERARIEAKGRWRLNQSRAKTPFDARRIACVCVYVDYVLSSSGGEVKRLEGDIPHRVFLKDKLYPGLAMSR